MDFSKERLLASGFTEKELQKLQNNIDNFGGTFETVVRDLGRRFKVTFSIVIVMCLLFTYAVFFEPMDKIISLGISLLIASILVLFIQPPMISFKCWRFLQEER
ncbi:MAG: hypothetical protein WCD24_01585 [Serratia inhibens]|uniref:hypothetical protein n=1 Tax=Serratia inhibens TaxID=2338073 RepID=UPI003C7A6D3E